MKVVAYRYGDKDEGYIVAYACDQITADRIAFDEQELRGGKYTVEVQEQTVDQYPQEVMLLISRLVCEMTNPDSKVKDFASKLITKWDEDRK